jgi:hypothetical protein
VDDVTLLALTLQAIRVELRMCEDFATEFSFSFNIKKTKCILFSSHKSRHSHYPLFYLNGKPTEHIMQWPHLGNILNVIQHDSANILFRRNSSVGKINDVSCSFNYSSAAIHIKLLHTYCISLYGSVLWNLSAHEADTISTAWCKDLIDVLFEYLKILTKIVSAFVINGLCWMSFVVDLFVFMHLV